MNKVSFLANIECCPKFLEYALFVDFSLGNCWLNQVEYYKINNYVTFSLVS